MISRADIAHWGVEHPWQTAHQVEQDLLLSQAICCIANDSLLGSELVFRGGTALHKLFLPKPLRYSEDLDYVRTTTGGIGPIMNQLTDLGRNLGFRVSTKMGLYPKVLWKFTYEDGDLGKIKIEINTFERLAALELQYRQFSVDNPYYQGSATVHTFQVEELIASKLRALYQRAKGRDLFDIWLALTSLDLNPSKILAAFPSYMPEGANGAKLIENLEAKLQDRGYCSDMDKLIRNEGTPYDPQLAGQLVIDKLLNKIDEANVETK